MDLLMNLTAARQIGLDLLSGWPVGLCFLLLGALCFRIRGSALWDLYTRTGTTGGRMQYAILMAIACMLLQRDWLLALMVPALFLGCVPPWFADGMVPLTVRRFAANAARGVLWLLPAAGLLWWLDYPGWVDIAVAGAASAPLYWFAWHLPCPLVLHRGHVVIGPGTELGEALYGAWIGLCLYHALTAAKVAIAGASAW